MSVKYTEKEIKKLKDLNSQGLGPKEISSHFPNRSYSSIKAKLIELNLKIKSVDNSEFQDNLERQLVKRIQTEKYSVTELANFYDVSPKRIEDTISQIKRKGYNVELKEESISIKKEGKLEKQAYQINVNDFFGKKIKFGAIADTHLGSKSERLDVLNSLYDIFQKEGVKVVLHGGNYVDGEFYFNKHETKTHGFDDMIEYFLEHYPKRDGMQTWFISGDDHEGWWMQREGLDAGRIIMERQKDFGRDDLVYLGYQERDILLKSEKGSAILRLMHAGGGTAYADSYSTQKIVESYMEGEKPHMLLVGHYHKSIYHTPRGIHTLQLGTTQDQTRFMRKNKIRAHLGGWLVELNQSPTGEINRFKPEWIQFWGEGFYTSKIGKERNLKPLEYKV